MGVIVLLFSIVLPLDQVVAADVSVPGPLAARAASRAITYRFVEHLGRWGMVDVLLVAVMVAFVKLGGLVNFGAGPGVILFGMFVEASLCASLAFDPHCMWSESADRLWKLVPRRCLREPGSPDSQVRSPSSEPWPMGDLDDSARDMLIVGGIFLRGCSTSRTALRSPFNRGMD